MVLLSAAALTVLNLLTSVSLAAECETAAGLMESCGRLRRENSYLSQELSCRLSIRELERYAREELGMIQCPPENIIYYEATDK